MYIFLDVGQKKINHLCQSEKETYFIHHRRDGLLFLAGALVPNWASCRNCSEIVPQKYPSQLVRFDKVSFLPGNNRLPHLVNFPLALIRLSANAEMN